MAAEAGGPTGIVERAGLAVKRCRTIASLWAGYGRCVVPCHAVPWYGDMPCHAMPCHAVPRHAMPCHAMPCHANITTRHHDSPPRPS